MDQRNPISTDRFRALVNSTAQIVWTTDPDGLVSEDSPSWRRYTGQSFEEWVGFGWLSVIHPDDRSRVQNLWLDAVANKTELKTEYRLRHHSQTWRWTEVSAVPILNNDGVVVEFVGMNSDIDDRKTHQNQLRKLKNQLLELANHAPVMLAQLDWQLNYTFVNDQYAHFFGRQPKDIIGKNASEVLGEEGFEDAKAYMISALAGNSVEYDFHINAAEKSRHLTVRYAPERDDAEEVVGFVAAILDVTEKKNAEQLLRERQEHSELLMREVNHRANNLLAVIQTVARQTARESAPDQFADNLIQRLRSLSTSQDLIIKGDWKAVPIRELFEKQLAHLGDTFQDRVNSSGPSLRLSPQAAQGIGMAFHELSTNAVKYGALANQIGNVNITWKTKSSDANEEILEVVWQELGLRNLKKPTRTGFGKVVIEKMAARAVNGIVELKYKDTGLVWTLTAPIENSLATL